MNRRTFLSISAGAALAPTVASALPDQPKKLPMPPAELWDPFAGQAHEGEAPGPNGNVYYRRYDARAPKPGRAPVIVLHGGPAGGNVSMRPYAGLAGDLETVLYDQSGCGRSARPADLQLYTVERYVAELEALRVHLKYEKISLVGASWGGMLAIAYAQAHPDRVPSMVLASTAPVLSDFSEAAYHWLGQMGDDAVRIATEAERTGKTSDPIYVALMERYYAQHLCRLDPWPKWLLEAVEEIGKNPVYHYMNGPSELTFTGSLKDMDLRPGLKDIRARTLVTCGEFDESPPWIGQRMVDAIPGARLQAFSGLSHCMHIEDPARVVGATRDFLVSAGG